MKLALITHSGSNGTISLPGVYFPSPIILVEIDITVTGPNLHIGSWPYVIKFIIGERAMENPLKASRE